MLRHPCILGDPQHRGTKLKVAASPLSSRRPNRGRKCYITPAFLGIPNIGDKVKSGCLTLAFSGAQKRAEKLRHQCILGDPQHRVYKSKVATSPLPFRGPKRGRKCYITPAFLGIPNIGDKNKKWLPHPCLLGGPKEGQNATSPVHSLGSPTPSVASKIRSGPQHRGTKLKVAASPLPSRGPKRGRKCYITPAFLGIPNIGDKVKSGCLTLAFSGAQKRAEMLRHPCILGDPQHRV